MAVNNTLIKNSVKPAEVNYKAGTEDVRLTPDIVKKYLVSGDSAKVTDSEIRMFMSLCKYQHLNPFLHEAYLIKYGNNSASLVVGKSAFEKRAARCEKYRGFEAGIMIITADGKLEKRSGSLVLDNEKLVGGWAEIYVDGFQKPVSSVVSLTEYAGFKNDGTLNKQWSSKPATMIRKVAKTQALREAFPEDFAGMYTAEEKGIDEPPVIEIPAEANENPPARQLEAPSKDFPEQLELVQDDDFARIMEG